MFKISEFSKLCQVPASALRYYDDIGLLHPAQIDRFTGYRYYTFDQLPRLNRILALKELGLSLEQIAELLDEDVPAEQIRGMLRLKQAELHQRVQDEQERLIRVEARLKQIESEGKMSDYDVVLKKIEPTRVIAIRQIVPMIAQIAPLWDETYKALRAHGQDEVSPHLSIVYDEAFTANDMDMEIIYPVAESCPDTIDLASGRQMTSRTLEGVELAACAVHKGDYSGLSEAYASLGRWIAANGYRIIGAPREVYLRGGGGSDALTEIQFPVAIIQIPAGWSNIEGIKHMLTQRAEEVLLKAAETATTLDQPIIQPKHILYSLIQVEQGLAGNVLKKSGVQLPELKAEQPPQTGVSQVSAASQQVIEMAVDEARQLKHDYLGTEHFLLSLLKSGDAQVLKILHDAGIQPHQLRDSVMLMLNR